MAISDSVYMHTGYMCGHFITGRGQSEEAIQ
jgi:hypothetical protein